MAAKKTNEKSLFKDVAKQLGWSEEKVKETFIKFVAAMEETIEPNESEVEEEKAIPQKEETYTRKLFGRRDGVVVMTPPASEMGDEVLKENHNTVSSKTESAIFRGNGKPNYSKNNDMSRRGY